MCLNSLFTYYKLLHSLLQCYETFIENNLTDWMPTSPTYLLHSLGDSIIIAANSQVTYDSFVENGAIEVYLNLYPEEVGGHAEAAPVLINDAFNLILDYQIINPIGDFNSDGNLTDNDYDLLTQSILDQEIISGYQWWAGDLDYDDEHTILDIITLINLTQD